MGRAIEGPPRGDFGGLETAMYTLGGVLIGTAVGTVCGLTSGHRYYYEFTWFSRKISSGADRGEQKMRKGEEQSR